MYVGEFLFVMIGVGVDDYFLHNLLLGFLEWICFLIVSLLDKKGKVRKFYEHKYMYLKMQLVYLLTNRMR